MATKMVQIDDLDGTTLEPGDGGTVTFAIKGENYEVDLSSENERKLLDALAPFIAVARKVEPRTRVEAASVAPREERAYEPREAREWLLAQGHELPERGPIKRELLRLFEEAHGYAS
jgi:hypothetical protein